MGTKQAKQQHIWLLIFVSIVTACAQDHPSVPAFGHPGYDFPYDLAVPDQSWALPSSLAEISGLGFIDDQRLACVQDEQGIIYVFHTGTGQIEREIGFGEEGDYEGIEIAGKDAWILKSNGTIYRVTDYTDEASAPVTKHSTSFSGRNDTEGLAYDPFRRHMLIACKGKPFLDKRRGKGVRAVYRFDLETERLDPQPYLLIHLDTIKQCLHYSLMARWGVDVMAFIAPSMGDVSFAPSGIAVHPITGNIFVLGSVGKLLLVYSGTGDLLAAAELDPGIFTQPEGICFGPDGTLYIASEGDGRGGTLWRFRPAP